MRRSTVLCLPFQLVFPGQAVDETTDVQSRLNCLACLVCLHLAHRQKFTIDKKKVFEKQKKTHFDEFPAASFTLGSELLNILWS